MLARVPAARVVLVQKMESGLAEAIVGYRDDPVVGPIALVGREARSRKSTRTTRCGSRR